MCVLFDIASCGFLISSHMISIGYAGLCLFKRPTVPVSPLEIQFARLFASAQDALFGTDRSALSPLHPFL